MKKIILSNQIASELEKAIPLSIVRLNPYKKLQLPVSSHPDMLLFVIDRSVFCYKEYFELNRGIFAEIESLGYEIIKVEKECQEKYPNDIALNVLKVGRFLFGKKEYIAKEILEYAEKNGYTVICVNQGYSACSTLVLNENNVITNDKSIEKAINNIGKNALFIPNSGIDLEGYNCGFIGGASFVFDNTVYFFGDYKLLPDYKAIEKKILSLNMNIFSLSTGRVFDFGGAKVVY